VLPDDGPVGPKHVGLINFNVLISVKVLKYKRFWNKKTLVQIVGLIIYIPKIEFSLSDSDPSAQRADKSWSSP
jgi:hypothetical protein